MDAACHHGGAGTSGASLRGKLNIHLVGSARLTPLAGIPTIIKPFFGDQAFWSERVESLGVGSAVRKLTAENLTEALLKATTDEKQIAKAKVVGEMIRKVSPPRLIISARLTAVQENGVAKAIEAIYRDLEYAKSIVKPAPTHADDGGPLGLGKVSSLLAPITSNRSRHKSGGEADHEKMQDVKEGGEGSEESWDVVSNSGTPERA